jgi:hypothetical protein
LTLAAVGRVQLHGADRTVSTGGAELRDRIAAYRTTCPAPAFRRVAINGNFRLHGTGADAPDSPS